MIISQISSRQTVNRSGPKCMSASRCFFANMRILWKIHSAISRNIWMILKNTIICAAALFGISWIKPYIKSARTVKICGFTATILQSLSRVKSPLMFRTQQRLQVQTHISAQTVLSAQIVCPILRFMR